MRRMLEVNAMKRIKSDQKTISNEVVRESLSEEGPDRKYKKE